MADGKTLAHIGMATMREVLRSNDAVLIGFAESLLRERGIDCLIADQHISVMEGSIGAFPRRLLVGEANLAEARRTLEEAGLGQWIVGDGEAQA
jgi:Putative prokaryotic signal transducing protein